MRPTTRRGPTVSHRRERGGDVRRLHVVRTIVSIGLLALVACQSKPAVERASLIVHNARVYTVNDAQPEAQAVAVRGDRIVLVGSNEDALALRGAGTTVIDALGATVLPGLQDSHGHFTGLGTSLQSLDLRGT